MVWCGVVQVEGVHGVLNNFLVEPFVEHKEEEEVYICILSLREGDQILFHHQGGINVGDIDSKVSENTLFPSLLSSPYSPPSCPPSCPPNYPPHCPSYPPPYSHDHHYRPRG